MDSADFDQLTRSLVTRDSGGSPMDADRFDAIARSLTTGRSRRGAVRLFAAGTLSGAALLRGQDTTARCRSSRRCGPQKCCPKGQICGDEASQTCVTGKGTCSAGDNRCDDPTKMCNDHELCGCLPTIEKGKTRCVSLLTLGSCCGKDADCAESHPDVPGAVCMAPTDCNTDCQNNPPGSNGQCYAPCPQPE